ncbi:MAG: hypothetical protein ACFFD4_37360 [Candidatus Odinarchaeota archaeon]
MILRVGIDTGWKTGGALGPIFDDGSFEFIPIKEKNPGTGEMKTYGTTLGRKGKLLSTYLPPGLKDTPVHFDPEFESFTYGDPTGKRYDLLKLEKGDLLVYYAGLTPYRTREYKEALYLIGYFTVDKIIDISTLSEAEITRCREMYPNNAHWNRRQVLNDLVVAVGDPEKSRLLDKAVLLSRRSEDSAGNPLKVVSRRMEQLLGISGSIQRSKPVRTIRDEKNLANLKQILEIV